MTKTLTTLGFDADDTLWHNERFFRITQERFADLLSDFTPQDHLEARLLEAEKRNNGHYGFGVKGFVLSMIETAIEVTQGRVPACVISELMAAGRDMLEHPIELLPGVEDTIRELSKSHSLILVTKGDLLDQERKLAQSGLGEMFNWVEIVSHKTPDIYTRVFSQHGDGAARALMVGNSLRSDVLPALAAGSWGVHVPHGMTWALEHAEPPVGAARFAEIESLDFLPDLVRNIG
ncbi:HAD family hydrolase [Shimia litoralis]|uniref:HAD family hydrolase n=1 Tax=Shimia litoralis TaxID=420403 RepID=A0A4U7N8L4_9RHOB|nr:HAD family hydrolase [Shimia litoralis]TKZ22128.1 HAD family hydrolase [Shimia litoralis]